VPLEHLAHGFRHAITFGLDIADLAILLAWALAGLAIAISHFDWLPSTDHGPHARPGGSARSGDERATRDESVRLALISAAEWQARLILRA
jgi:hypothetical protein